MEISLAIWVPTFLALWAVILYWFLTKNFNYWKNHGIPYAPAVPIIGSMGALLTKTSHEIEKQRYKKYGRVFGYFESERPVLNVADPELLKNILVKDFQSFVNRRDFAVGDPIMDKLLSVLRDESWKRVRTIITPAFSTGKIKKMTGIILNGAKSLSHQFTEFANSKESFDAKRAYSCFTMDIIASAAFGTKIDSHQNPNNEFVVAARKAFNKNTPWRFVVLFLFPKLMRLFHISLFQPEAVAFFRDATLEIIKERKKTKKVYNDFLQLLMDAAEEESKNSLFNEISDKHDASSESVMSDMGHEEGNEQVFKQSSNYKSITYDELVAQSVIFFLAGFDTTASTLAFASYLLALHPDLQEKVIAEVDKTIKDNGNEITYEAVQSMKFLDKVIWETLRMFPPAIRTERVAKEDYELGIYNYTIPKEMVVGIPVYAIHYDPEFYPEPEKFDPERFSPEEKSRRHAYTYLPFGAGPRNCIGMRFALMEIKVCLAYTFSQYRFKKSPNTKVPLDFYTGQGLLQPKEVLLEVEVRQDRVYSS